MYIRCAYHWLGQARVRPTGDTRGMDEYPEPVHDPADGALDPRAELSEFLRTRRARLKPEDVGLPDFGQHRRVPGLRREELAQLAGVSMGYYTRLEQGNGRHVSAEVLDAIARALRLSDAEHAHLTHLAKPKQKKKRMGRTQRVRGSLRTLLDTMEGGPAILVGRRGDILAWNRMAAAVFGDWAELPAQERNWARLVFLRPEYRDLFVDWEHKANDVVSQLRMDSKLPSQRPPAVRAGGRTLREERGVPAAVGRPRRQGQVPRHPAPAPSARRRTRSAPRVVPPGRRPRTDAGDLPRRTRFHVGGGTTTAGQLGHRRDKGGSRDAAGDARLDEQLIIGSRLRATPSVPSPLPPPEPSALARAVSCGPRRSVGIPRTLGTAYYRRTRSSSAGRASHTCLARTTENRSTCVDPGLTG